MTPIEPVLSSGARSERETEGVTLLRHNLESVSVGRLIVVAKRSKPKRKVR
jgi:hypothetical protein